MLILSLYSADYPRPVITIHSAVDDSIKMLASGLRNHPKFNIQTSSEYDIALLRLKEPFPLIKEKTAALHPAGQNATTKPESCVAVGWGRKRHVKYRVDQKAPLFEIDHFKNQDMLNCIMNYENYKNSYSNFSIR